MPIYQIIILMQQITSVFQSSLKVNCLEFIKLSSEAICILLLCSMYSSEFILFSTRNMQL